MRVHVSLCCRYDGHWYVTGDGQYLVGFSGPAAKEMATRQRRELAELLNGGNQDAPDDDEEVDLLELER
jgi:hypothetical protein